MTPWGLSFLAGFLVFAGDALLLIFLVGKALAYQGAGAAVPTPEGEAKPAALLKWLGFGIVATAKTLFLLSGIYLALDRLDLPGEALMLGAVAALLAVLVGLLVRERRRIRLVAHRR